MCPLRYYPMLRQSKEPVRLRFELVRYAREHGIKPAAREFSTCVNQDAGSAGPHIDARVAGVAAPPLRAPEQDENGDEFAPRVEPESPASDSGIRRCPDSSSLL